MSINRIQHIDFMRAIAIIIMIIANSCPYILIGPHATILRIFASLAAPLFIFLSGFSAYLSNANHAIKHQLTQALYLFISAILLDALVWHIRPLQTFDVLYLIAFGIIANAVMQHSSWKFRLFIAILCVLISFFLRQEWGYRFLLEEIPFSGKNFIEIKWVTIIDFKRMLLDGWFPIMPWIGLAILGNIIAEKSNCILQYPKTITLVCLWIFVIGIAYFLNQDPIQAERNGYLELFYPPTLSYLIFACAFIALIYVLTLKCSLGKFFKAFNLIGRNSLLIYWLHSMINAWILEVYVKPFAQLTYSIIAFLLIGSCFLMAGLNEWLGKKNALILMPYPLKKILGLK